MSDAFTLKKKRDTGICLDCSATVVPDRRRCQKCLDRMIQFRKQRIESGLCLCGQPLVTGRSSCELCLEKRRSYSAAKRKARINSKLCRDCGRPSTSPLCPTCLAIKKQQNITFRTTLKYSVLSYYSIGDVPQCQCCGETILSMLTIDHIAGNGNQHREAVTHGRGAETFYRWLKNNNYPAEYRTLCFNCNVGAHQNNGVCPHQTDCETKYTSTSAMKS